MPRTKRDWRQTGRWVSDAQAEADRGELQRRFERLSDCYGLSGLREGFLEAGWTDDQLCQLIRRDPGARWEWTLIGLLADAVGLGEPTPEGLAREAAACAERRAAAGRTTRPAPVMPRSAYADLLAEARRARKRRRG